MGTNLRDIRRRIIGIEKTQKITRAMKMVSAAKLNRAISAIVSARPYADKIDQVLASVAGGVDALSEVEIKMGAAMIAAVTIRLSIDGSVHY